MRMYGMYVQAMTLISPGASRHPVGHYTTLALVFGLLLSRIYLDLGPRLLQV